MFKPTANAGGKGGVLDRDNPLLEEKFAVIGDGEHEYVLLSFCSSFVFERFRERIYVDCILSLPLSAIAFIIN
jgi:hypothetical protein